ncbi:glucose-specific phosphotransferase system IIA component [Clostridium tetanomorphum]|uniref:PTS glucose transporter subunit IIA n=1 Tax=Clostridium tetanomorphum TaxID=1553 RepID=A0A923EB93_CLOTT|nr:PTS glucose transporter subunit IIA [Clostridium tetanomorphum]KAJ53021.1 PTS system glucose subfamily transporter subunit IIA [Clostridium tetanomorphum DSM 665]MBC2398554.1 PTS glucose transporter subunit IIA [Clostridium tetanomorphum]MBP1864964.1 glucose-specific phosphotransferase system IIA component [Clostridium tetanomorphum]NRS83170.1 glucose-specific phosphotransferase system IIA component [Clostridium tetanomorphum]NRZ98729.1 glucose-specific phosphotransferase system IIA compone
MFNLFKKSNSIIAPMCGRVLDLSKVPDGVFASRLAGDGVAIDCSEDVIVAPADGTLSLIFKTNHAFGITLDNGIELLIHIGIDTVKLKGEGFQRLAREKTRVKVGEPIVRINRKFIKEKGYSLISPILITNVEKIEQIKGNVDIKVTSGKDIIFTYKIK